jgi:hypothetical protein
MPKLPKTREQYLEAIERIMEDGTGEYRQTKMLGLLVEAVVDLKEATEIPYVTSLEAKLPFFENSLEELSKELKIK